MRIFAGSYFGITFGSGDMFCGNIFDKGYNSNIKDSGQDINKYFVILLRKEFS